MRFPCTINRVIDPGHFYIMFQIYAEKLTKIKEEMTEFYSVEANREQYRRKEAWQEGDLCAALRKEDSIWYRAIIMNLLPDQKAKLLVKDIAVEETVEVDDLYDISKDFKNYPDISVRCHLCDLMAPGGSGLWPSIAIEEFQEHVSTRKIYFMQKGEVDESRKSVPAELWIKSSLKESGPLEPIIDHWYTINQYLIDKGLALCDKNLAMVSPSSEILKNLLNIKKNTPTRRESKPVDVVSETEDSTSSISTKLIIEKEITKTREDYLGQSIKEWLPALPLESMKFLTAPSYVDHDACIYVQEPASCDTLHVLSTTLCAKYNGTKPQAHDSFWSVGQLCIVQYHADLKWYRGQVLKLLPDNKYKVVMSDYGNIEECKAADMRKNLLMTQIPLQCHRCQLSNLRPNTDDGKWTVPILDYIHSTVVERQCEVELTGSIGNYSIKRLQVLQSVTLTELLVEMQYATEVDDDGRTSINSDDDDDDSDSVIVESEELVTHHSITANKNSTEDLSNSLSEQLMQLKFFEQLSLQTRSSSTENKTNSIEDETEEGKEVQDDDKSFDKNCHRSWIEMMEEEQSQKSNQDVKIRQQYKYFEVPEYISELEVEVLCILSPTIYFVSVENKELFKWDEFIVMQEEMQCEAESLPIIQNPTKGQVCCSKFSVDNKWYRGQIVDVSNAICVVKYVDYGNLSKVPSSQIHELKLSWLEIPVQGLQCKLSNVCLASDAVASDCIAILESKLFEPHITAKIKSHNPLAVELYTKEKELVYQELLDKNVFVSVE